MMAILTSPSRSEIMIHIEYCILFIAMHNFGYASPEWHNQLPIEYSLFLQQACKKTLFSMHVSGTHVAAIKHGILTYPIKARSIQVKPHHSMTLVALQF